MCSVLDLKLYWSMAAQYLSSDSDVKKFQSFILIIGLMCTLQCLNN